MSLERQLLEHAELIAWRVKDPDVARLLRADLVAVAALAAGDRTITRTVEILLAHTATLLEYTAPARPSDAEIAASAHSIGVRATARLTGVSRSTVSRIARVVPLGTPTALPVPEPERRVGALIRVMEPGDVPVASFVHNCGAPTAATDKGDTMLGNGSNGREVVRSDLTRETLLERLERLEKLPGNAEGAAKQQAERLQIRARLVQERDALSGALTKEGAILAKRVEKAQHAFEWATGPEARAEAQATLGAVLLEQLSNSLALELKPAAFDRELRRTADPRLDEFLEWLEGGMAATRCYGPPFVPNTLTERERMIEEARLAPPPDDGPRQFDNPRRNDFVVHVPFLHGGYDASVQKALGARLAALRAAHSRTHELKLLPLSAAQVIQEIDALKAGIPQIPADASLNAPLPTVREADLSKILQVRKADGAIEQVEARDGRREAPKRMPPDGTRYINGVPQ